MYSKLDPWVYYVDNNNLSYKTVKTKSKVFGDLQYNIRYVESRNCIQVNFQCTAGYKDWISNFDFPSAPYEKILLPDGSYVTMKVHSGWMNMYLLGKVQIREEFNALYSAHKDAVVEVIGYSLGGALAQICAQDLSYNFVIKPYLITFGSPNPWYGNATTKYVQNYCVDMDNSAQYDNYMDIVTTVPPEWLGYHKIKDVKVDIKRNWLEMFKPQIYHCKYSLPEIYN